MAGRQIRSETRWILIPLIVQESIVGPGGAIHDAKVSSVTAYLEILTAARRLVTWDRNTASVRYNIKINHKATSI